MTRNNREPAQKSQIRGITRSETTEEPELRARKVHKRRIRSVPTKASQKSSRWTKAPHAQTQEYREGLMCRRREAARNGQTRGST